jgi:DNA helicase-2/ATP-dependent DNA helicase PcrA
VLPFPLRGDADGLPTLNLATAGDARAVRTAVEEFDDAWRAHQEREERRLAYVAVTRPRHLLLCSGFRWGEGLSEPRNPSIFLEEIAQECLAGAGAVQLWTEPAAEEENPTLVEEVSAQWPIDPLAERRGAIAEGAAMVRAALTGGAAATEGVDADADAAAEELARRWAAETDLLLAERDRLRVTETIDVVLPEHLSVSQLVALRRDPQRLARRLRRPLPEAPDPYARRGTAFHLWLERRFGGGELLDLDDLPGSGDEGAAPDAELEQLQKQFLASEWADRAPARVEVPFATVVAGVVVRGRMDAVFEVPGRPGYYDVIDWKTGQKPTGADATAAAVQLAAYRLAWAELAKLPVAQVGAGFHYVRDAVTVRPTDLLDAEALVALVVALPHAGVDRSP